MSRISIPEFIDAAPETSKGSLEAFNKLLGTVPNMFRLIGNSPTSPGRIFRPERCTWYWFNRCTNA